MLFHHMPGWDAATKEMARKLAHNGYIAISPNLHYREGSDDPSANSASIRDKGGMPDARTLGDAAGAIGYLRHLDVHNGKVGIIGFCSGGRQVFLAACKLQGVDAAVDCWGGGVTQRDSEPPTEAMPHAPIEFVSDLSCPVMGLFGEDDARPSIAEVEATDAAIKAAGKSWEYHTYPNAGPRFLRGRPAQLRGGSSQPGLAGSVRLLRAAPQLIIRQALPNARGGCKTRPFL